MIRIVAIQRSSEVCEEFVLLQNHGSMMVNLKGHALLAECLDGEEPELTAAHVFTDDIDVPAGQYVLLRTCPCRSGWRQADNHIVYLSSMMRIEPYWKEGFGTIHLLRPQHAFCDKRPAATRV